MDNESDEKRLSRADLGTPPSSPILRLVSREGTESTADSKGCRPKAKMKQRSRPASDEHDDDPGPAAA